LPAAGANAATIVAKGTPLAEPDGIAVAQSGAIYISDRAAAGNGLGKIFKISGGAITTIVEQVKLGNPAGIALAKNDTLLLVSAYQANSSDQVLVVNLATLKTQSVTKVVGQNNYAGGLHRSPGAPDVYSWAGKNGGGGNGGGKDGQVYLVNL
jgi:DNA-binding beta-propeller fold protein YncE